MNETIELKVKDGKVQEVKKKLDLGVIVGRTIGWLFVIYVVLAIANCAVHEGVGLYTTIEHASR